MSVSKHKETLLREASRWFARMQGPDAEASRFAFEAWRRSDPEHDLAFRRLEQSWNDASLVAHTSVGRNRSLARARRPLHGVPGWRIAAAAAAGLLLVVGGATLLYRELARSFLPHASEIATSVGRLRTVQLADGSTVTLDTDSAVTVDLGATRRVLHLLRGRARFDVAHDVHRPFAVDAGDGEIVARGTLFDVDLTRPDLRVTLYRGAVDVRVKPRDGSSSFLRRLAPGQRFVQVSDGFEPAIDPAPTGEERWTGGMLSFDNAPLAEVVAQANRYTKEPIRVGPAAADLKVTGAFKSGDSGELARSLAAMFDLPLRHQDDGPWELGGA